MKTTGLVHLVCALVLMLGGGCPRRPRESTRPLHEAASSGDLKRMRSLLARGANPNKRDGYGRTPLHIAATTGHAGMVRLLIDNRADVDADDGDRGTPLHYAAQEGHAAVARRLIAGGAQIGIKGSKSQATPLDFAFWHHHLDIVELLLAASSDRNEAREWVTTQLHAAAEDGRLNFAELFLSRGAQINDRDIEGGTPLHKAVWENQLEMAEFLLAHGAQINAPNNRGETPLHVAAFNGYRELFDLLVTNGADIHVPDEQGREPTACMRSPHAPCLVKLTGEGERPRAAIVTMPASIRRLLRYYGVKFDRLWIPLREDLEGVDLKAIIRKSSRVETQTWFDRDYLLTHFTAFDQKYAGFFRKGRAYLLCNMEHDWAEEEIHDGFLYLVADGDYSNTAMMIIDYTEKVAVRVDCEGMR